MLHINEPESFTLNTSLVAIIIHMGRISISVLIHMYCSTLIQCLLILARHNMVEVWPVIMPNAHYIANIHYSH